MSIIFILDQNVSTFPLDKNKHVSKLSLLDQNVSNFLLYQDVSNVLLDVNVSY